jgi:hypothetical protein
VTRSQGSGFRVQGSELKAMNLEIKGMKDKPRQLSLHHGGAENTEKNGTGCANTARKQQI